MLLGKKAKVIITSSAVPFKQFLVLQFEESLAHFYLFALFKKVKKL